MPNLWLWEAGSQDQWNVRHSCWRNV